MEAKHRPVFPRTALVAFGTASLCMAMAACGESSLAGTQKPEPAIKGGQAPAPSRSGGNAQPAAPTAPYTAPVGSPSVAPILKPGECNPGGTEPRRRFLAATVPFGEECKVETQTRTCDGNKVWGAFSGTFTEANCTPTPKTCSLTDFPLDLMKILNTAEKQQKQASVRIVLPMDAQSIALRIVEVAEDDNGAVVTINGKPVIDFSSEPRDKTSNVRPFDFDLSRVLTPGDNSVNSKLFDRFGGTASIAIKISGSFASATNCVIKAVPAN